MTKHRTCIFAHYDASGGIKTYVRMHLAALRKICDTIIFVTTSERDRKIRAEIQGLVDDFQSVENKGYDFGMWQRAISKLPVHKIDELVLTNSSVLGPVWPLESCFEQMRDLPVDIWSMTDNHELLWHMQSYFLVFRARALHSAAFKQFWRQLLPYRDKWQTILSYELGLSTYFRENDFYLRALYPSHSVDDRSWQQNTSETPRPRNPVMAWPQELMRLGFPYVKIELLRENPYKIDLAHIYQHLAQAGYDEEAIEIGQKASNMRNINI